ncbi:unnamed protein product, partial [Ectocarpus sp. 12 AP-2014]
PRFAFPTCCPACGTPVVKEEDKAVTRCPAGLSCPAQAVERLKHFVSKGAFDIQGLGPARLLELYEAGIVRSPVDVLRLRLQTAVQARPPSPPLPAAAAPLADEREKELEDGLEGTSVRDGNKGEDGGDKKKKNSRKKRKVKKKSSSAAKNQGGDGNSD